MARPPPQRILLEPAGTAVVLRTPLFRSARFDSAGAAQAWLAAQRAALVPVVVAGGGLVVARELLAESAFLALVLPVLALGVAGSLWVDRRERASRPAPRWLSWRESVALDPEPHPLTPALRDLGAAAASAALLALVAVLIEDDGGRHLREQGALTELLAAVFVLALAIGVVAGGGSAVQRIRFHLARRPGQP